MNTRIISSDNVWMEGIAINQFNHAASLEGIIRAVAFPDLHPGKGIPVGAAYITENIIYPHLIGNDIGCGIGLWQTEMKLHKLKIDKCVKKLETYPGSGCDASSLLQQNELPGDLAVEALGTIGGGNHFAEIQQIEAVEDHRLFEQLELDRKKVLVMVHCGSRGFGNLILQRHIDRYGAAGLNPETDAGREYLTDHDTACAWSKVNRLAVAGKVVGLLNLGMDKLVSDTVHNAVCRLKNGSWLHRKGAAAAETSPVVIAGSRGDFSYLVMPVDSGVENGFSLAHGAGRKWQRSEVKGRLSHKFKPDSLIRTELGGRVICHDRDLLYEEAPQAYKRIETVIETLKTAGLIKVIATLRPLITYKKGIENE